ncbi:MAG: FkbM family methyltransferase [Holosporaceae bacterium]|jgi:FkbM family methyltransferase|nr:FkbM family methyltransferase [Holosporaceae bacterium]
MKFLKKLIANSKRVQKLYWRYSFLPRKDLIDPHGENIASFVRSEFFQHFCRKYTNHNSKSTVSINDIAEKLDKICMYEKARTLMRDGIYSIQHNDDIIRFYLPNAFTDVVQGRIFSTDKFFEYHELTTIQKYINKDSIVVDAGANIGNHTVFFAKICKAKEVYCFEPLKRSYDILEKNIELNDVKNVKKFNFALGEHKGKAKIAYFDIGGIGSTQFREDEDGNFDVVTLDSLNLKQVDFCKIDVEGAQYSVLKGAKKTLEKFRPMIWIELLDEASNSVGYDKEKELMLPQRFLNGMGYVLFQKITPIDYLYIHKDQIKDFSGLSQN